MIPMKNSEKKKIVNPISLNSPKPNSLIIQTYNSCKLVSKPNSGAINPFRDEPEIFLKNTQPYVKQN